jgi:hypothetical protein
MRFAASASRKAHPGKRVSAAEGSNAERFDSQDYTVQSRAIEATSSREFEVYGSELWQHPGTLESQMTYRLSRRTAFTQTLTNVSTGRRDK